MEIESCHCWEWLVSYTTYAVNDYFQKQIAKKSLNRKLKLVQPMNVST